MNDDHPGLGRRIGRPASGHQPGNTGDVDDGAGAGVEHGRQRGLGEAHHRGHVDVELRLQQCGIGRPEFAGRPEAGVVHQYPHSRGEPVGDLVAVGGVGQVRGQNLDAGRPRLASSAGQLLQTVDITGDQNQVVAVARIASRVAAADPGRGPGDQGYADAARLSVLVVAGLTAVATHRRRAPEAFGATLIAADRLRGTRDWRHPAARRHPARGAAAATRPGRPEPTDGSAPHCAAPAALLSPPGFHAATAAAPAAGR